MSEPVITVRLKWWERRLCLMFGRKIYIDGKFAGWWWNDRWCV